MKGTHLSWTTPTLPHLGDPTWAPDPSQQNAHDHRIDEFGHFKGRVHHTLTHPLVDPTWLTTNMLSKLNPLIL